MSKSTLVHAISPRTTGPTRTPTLSSPNLPGSARNQSGSRPTPTSAPRVMSPEIPLNGSRIAIVTRLKLHAPDQRVPADHVLATNDTKRHCLCCTAQPGRKGPLVPAGPDRQAPPGHSPL